MCSDTCSQAFRQFYILDGEDVCMPQDQNSRYWSYLAPEHWVWHYSGTLDHFYVLFPLGLGSLQITSKESETARNLRVLGKAAKHTNVREAGTAKLSIVGLRVGSVWDVVVKI